MEKMLADYMSKHKVKSKNSAVYITLAEYLCEVIEKCFGGKNKNEHWF
ncbi:MAG: hypothetical protein QXV57_08840 [Thermoproteota archaeon]